MGWCSATKIMDTALKAAEVAINTAIEQVSGQDAREWANDLAQPAIDDALRPFVATLAKVLRDGDWDCIEESDYFERFPQEMFGDDDQEYLAYLVEQVKDAADYQSGDLEKWTDKLAEHQRKMGTN